MTLAAGVRLGPYEILAPLGKGGMGEVWRARDTRLGREVALKFLPAEVAEDPERHARFEREAKLLAALNHPNVAVLYGLEHLDGQHALAMELVEGDGLDERIARGPVPVEEAVAIARQIASGVEAAHEKGIVHRDLKPANVRLRPDGAVKVLDFGLAKAMESAPAEHAPGIAPTLTGLHTRAGMVMGTAAYMAPEQARGEPVDRRADIWAFGVVLYEMLTGRKPFLGATTADTLAAVLTGGIEWASLPGATPVALRRLTARCLERDPRRRLRDVGEARVLLEDLAAGVDGVAPPQRAVAPLRGRERLSWALAAVAAAAAVLSPLLLRRTVAPAETIRFTVAPPPGYDILPIVKLSPDARHVLVLLVDQAEKVSIAVRDLDALGMRQISGAENVRGGFWSPDGREIGFFADGKLSRVGAEGGPVQTVCESGSAFNGAWGPDGTILFVAEWGGPIVAVPAAGGAPRPVTTLDRSWGDVAHAHPAFLPDGRHFVFVAPNLDLAKTSVVLASLDSKETRRLFHADSSAVFASPGYLLFGRDDAVFAWRFDPRRLELVGDPAPAFEHVHWLSSDLLLGLSAARDRVAYLSWSLRRELVWVDRAGRTLGTLGGVGAYTDVRLSPDGRSVAVAARDPSRGRNLDLWVLDAARGTGTRITADRNDEFNPAWFPDGQRLVYVSDRLGVYDLYSRAVGGGAETLLVRSQRDKLRPTVLPDGRHLLADNPVGGLHARVLIDLAAGGSSRPLSSGSRFSEEHPELSPDGRWTAFDSNESGRREVYVQPLDGGPERQVSIEGGQLPVWSRSGSELFFVGRDGNLKSVPVHLAGGRVAIGEPQSLFPLQLGVDGELPFDVRPYDVSPDGQRFLVIRRAAGADPDGAVVVTNWTAVLRRPNL